MTGSFSTKLKSENDKLHSIKLNKTRLNFREITISVLEVQWKILFTTRKATERFEKKHHKKDFSQDRSLLWFESIKGTDVQRKYRFYILFWLKRIANVINSSFTTGYNYWNHGRILFWLICTDQIYERIMRKLLALLVHFATGNYTIQAILKDNQENGILVSNFSGISHDDLQQWYAKKDPLPPNLH